MKILLLSLCLAYATADVAHLKTNNDKDAQIIRQELDVNPEGNYQWAYETDNGIAANERGQLKDAGGENPAITVEGQAVWTAPDGEKIEFQYTADENGYQPQGAWIPTPPPIPEAIIRSLEYLRAHPPAPEKP